MTRFVRRGAVPAEILTRAGLNRHERVLACSPAADGSWVLGTRQRLVLVRPEGTRHVPWETVEDAVWDKEASRLKVTEIGAYGEQRPAYSFDMDDPTLLLQLVRERVTASIVLQRWVPVSGRRGLTVIGRRSPVGGPLTWMHSYDVGLDPLDPEVAAVADDALAAVRAEVGDQAGVGGPPGSNPI